MLPPDGESSLIIQSHKQVQLRPRTASRCIAVLICCTLLGAAYWSSWKVRQHRSASQLQLVGERIRLQSERLLGSPERILPTLIAKGVFAPSEVEDPLSGQMFRVFETVFDPFAQSSDVVAMSDIAYPVVPIPCFGVYAGCSVLYGDSVVVFESKAKCATLSLKRETAPVLEKTSDLSQ